MNIPVPNVSSTSLPTSQTSPMTAPIPLLTRLSHWARDYSEFIELEDLCQTLRDSARRKPAGDDVRPRVWNVPN